jgi:hypothetical protein
MGVLYSVIPLDEEVRNYLKKINIPFSNKAINGRNPMPSEIRAALNSLIGYNIEYSENGIGKFWQAFIEGVDPNGEWTCLNILNYEGEEIPQFIHFEKGWIELAIKISTALAVYCGTLVIFPDTGEEPFIITSEAER